VEAGFIEQTWNRTDQPVLVGAVDRTWVWGNAVTEPMSEPYDGAAATYAGEADASMTTHEDELIVQYFDKARMEYDENRPAEAPWNVTNGLLVKEMMTGYLQVGDDLFEQNSPVRNIPIAGDPDSGDITPSYADIGTPDYFIPYVDGAIVDLRRKQIEDPRNPGHYSYYPEADPAVVQYGVTAVTVDSPTKYPIASVFWDFMNSSGTIDEAGQQISGLLFQNPFYATGYPLEEPAWARARVGGVEKDVLVQCFERRCLTYTPDNPDGWKVEFGNVGQHYYQWRYEQLGIEITGHVTGFTVGQAFQQPSVITLQAGDTTYEVRLQFLQNIYLPTGDACYAEQALGYLQERISDEPVFFDGGSPTTYENEDVVNATPRRIWIGTEYLNETMVALGYATVTEDPHGFPDGFVRYPSPLLRERLEAAQAQAQADHLGMWGACQ
jgi:endonuclease YncB( thermonuclease family)